MPVNEQDNGNHLILGHNPLKSFYDQGEHLNSWAVYEDEFDELRIVGNLSYRLS